MAATSCFLRATAPEYCYSWRIMQRHSRARRWHFFFLKIAFLLLWLIGPRWLNAQTISGTVQDTSGAVIAGARIEITGADLAQPVVLSSNGVGEFDSPDLKPGTYSLRVTRDGFVSI